MEGDQIALTTDTGYERDENQDRAVVLRASGHNGMEYLLAVICDGMGGMQDGRACASIAASSVVVAFLRSRHLSTKERLRSAALFANQVVHGNFAGKGGATLSAVCFSDGEEAIGLNVGDSRIYGAKPGKLTALSADDTIAGQIGRGGGGAEAHKLLQFVGMGPDIDPHVIEIPGELTRTVIMTDGAHGIPEDALELLVTRASMPLQVTRRVVQAAQWMGTRDNGTAICVQAPVRFRPSAIERSVRLWDAWGELHLVNPTDGRPAKPEDVAEFGDFFSPDSQEPSPVERRSRRRKQSGKRNVTDAQSVLDDKPVKAPLSVEITQISEPTNEGNH